MQNPLKKKSTKIIQITHDQYIGTLGLGDDNKVYQWKKSNSTWCLYGEIDDKIWEELR